MLKTKTAANARPGKSVPESKHLKKRSSGKVEVLSSTLQYKGPLFSVYSDHVLEPGGAESQRDVVRHGGSVVILAVDESRSRRDPLVVLERQYRHAAGKYLWELPAGSIDEGEKRLPAAKRELIEETGYRARKWTPLTRYYASPGFLAEWMQIYLAEDLTLGDARPEHDERIEIYLVPLSEVLRLVDEGEIQDGKTLIGVQIYARRRKSR